MLLEKIDSMLFITLTFPAIPRTKSELRNLFPSSRITKMKNVDDFGGARVENSLVIKYLINRKYHHISNDTEPASVQISSHDDEIKLDGNSIFITFQFSF